MVSPQMDWLPLCGTVLVLGVRHGLDADHLAAIDGLTRFNFATSPRLARWCGMLFSTGHGIVVILVAATLGAAATAYTVPEWARAFGAWTSIVFLVGLGLLNLRMVLSTPVDETMHVGGIRSLLLSRLTRTSRPLAIVAIGSIFAISFDTLSQAVLFSASAAQFDGVRSGMELGVLFMLGMMLVDGVNGVWVASLLRRQDRRARIASRAIGLLVAVLSFGVAALGAVRYFNQNVDAALESRATFLGILIVLAVAASIWLIGRIGTGRLPVRARKYSVSNRR
jgi:nickel/cobalt transporter (NiCoT) family protein